MLTKQAIQLLIHKAIPFCLIREPGKIAKIVIQFQPLIGPVQSSAKGITFHPFTAREHQRSIQIRADYIAKLSAYLSLPNLPDYSYVLDNAQISEKVYVADEQEYLSSVKTISEEINSRNYEKLVYSRIIKKQLSNISVWDLFEKLCKNFSASCVYALHIPGESIWIGASPELLLEKNEKGYQTIALAGTIPTHSLSQWTEKERMEHAVVANYIEHGLDHFSLPFKKSPVYNKQIGLIQHLAQDFRFTCQNETRLHELTSYLHPSPAISGYPKEKSIEEIYNKEQHQRAFYTGYFKVNLAASNSTWINIRCAKMMNNTIYVYVGGGIMGDSDPKKEWIETQLKSRTILDLL